MFFINDILNYSIIDEEYECHHSLVLEEDHIYVKLKKGVFQLFGVSISN
jgi:hypothetical protein